MLTDSQPYFTIISPFPPLYLEDAHITCTPGAGHYLVQCGDTGSARKRSMSARHREGIHAGYPNALVQPVDTLGEQDLYLYG